MFVSNRNHHKILDTNKCNMTKWWGTSNTRSNNNTHTHNNFERNTNLNCGRKKNKNKKKKKKKKTKKKINNKKTHLKNQRKLSKKKRKEKKLKTRIECQNKTLLCLFNTHERPIWQRNKHNFVQKIYSTFKTNGQQKTINTTKSEENKTKTK